MIEIITRPTESEFSYASRVSDGLVRVINTEWRPGRLHRVVFMPGHTILSLIGEPVTDSDGYEVGTVSPGDKMLIDGDVYTVSPRDMNSPQLLRTDS